MLSLWQPIPIPVSAPFSFGKRANLVATPQSVRRVGLWLDRCISRASTLGTGSNILATRLPTISTSVTRQRWQRACSYAMPSLLARIDRRGHSLQPAFNPNHEGSFFGRRAFVHSPVVPRHFGAEHFSGATRECTFRGRAEDTR
jgi:hypothetical protein